MSQKPWNSSDSTGLEAYILSDQIQQPDLSLQISTNNKTLCSITGTKALNDFSLSITNSNDDESSELIQALKYVGAIPLKFSYSDHRNSSNSEKITTDADFEGWFNSLISKRKGFLDTNILRNRTFSSLQIAHGIQLTNTSFEIPRLAILELERQSNNDENKKIPNNLPYQAGLKKRKALLGFSELLYLSNKGAQYMPELPIETLTAFTTISGTQNTDAWIRREIKDREIFLMRSQIAIRPIFITSDMVNSISALAEGRDTIYVSEIPNWENVRLNMNSKQVSNFVIALSVLFNEVSININSNVSNLRGFWNGITTYDIINQKILIQAVS